MKSFARKLSSLSLNLPISFKMKFHIAGNEKPRTAKEATSTKKNFKTGFMLCHLYQSPMKTERWHRKEQRGRWMCDKLKRNKNMQISEFCLKGKYFRECSFFLALGHDGSVPPTTALSIAQKKCERGRKEVGERIKGKNTIFHFNKFLLKCQMPLTGNNSKNMFNVHPAI